MSHPNAPAWPSPPSVLDKLAAELLQIVRPQIDIETAREAARAVLEVVERNQRKPQRLRSHAL